MASGVDLNKSNSSYGTVLEHKGKRLMGKMVAGLDLNAQIQSQKDAILETKKPHEEKVENNAKTITALDELKKKYKDFKTFVNELTSNPRDAESKTRTSIFGNRFASTSSDNGYTADQIATFFTVTAADGATGNFTLKIDQIAKCDTRFSRAMLTTDTIGVGGTLTINGQGISVGGGDTLSSLALKINNVTSASSVKANVIMINESTGTYRLELVSTELATPIVLSDGGNGLLAALQDAPDDLSAPTLPSDLQAKFKYNGIDIIQNSNKFDRGGSIITLTAESTAEFTVSFVRDNEAIFARICDFVTKYNELSEFIAEKTAFETKDGVRSAKEGSDLYECDFVDKLMRELRAKISASIAGLSSSDYSVIPTMSVPGQEFGMLFKFDAQEGYSRFEVDIEKLKKTISNEPEKLEKLFSLQTETSDPKFKIWRVPQVLDSSLGGTLITVTFMRDGLGVLTGEFYDGTLTYVADMPDADGEGGMYGPEGSIFEGLEIMHTDLASLANGTSTSATITITQGVAHLIEREMDEKLDRDAITLPAFANQPPKRVDYFQDAQNKYARKTMEAQEKIKNIEEKADQEVEKMLKNFQGVYAAQEQYNQVTNMLDSLKSVLSN